jgi:hypothetical protein
MSALAAFVKGKVDESLTKLVQPAGLVPTAVFLLLNLAFVYPALKSDKVGWAISFGKLDENWQIVGVVAATLGLGYLLLSAGASILDLLTGESWRTSWLGKRLTNRTQATVVGRDRWRALAPGVVSIDELDDVLDLRMAYPVTSRTGEALTAAHVEDVGPTRLGNALRAGYRRLHERYGIDAVALWSDMEAAVPKDSAAKATLTDARASLDTLVNLSFVVGAFGVEGVLIHSARGSWSGALLCALALPVAYGVYRIAVPKALAWCDAMSVVCDLHRSTLRDELELRQVSSTADERALWHKVSRVFLWGRDGELTPDDIYEPPKPKATPEAAIGVSCRLELTSHGEREADLPGEGVAAGPLAGHSIELRLLVSHTRSASAHGVVTISHPSLPRIPGDPAIVVAPAATTPDPSVQGDMLVLDLPELQPDAAFSLDVRLPVWEVRVAPGMRVEVTPPEDEGALAYDIHISVAPNATPTERWLDVFVAATALTPLLSIPGQGMPELKPPTVSEHGRHRWTLTNELGPMTIGFFAAKWEAP